MRVRASKTLGAMCEEWKGRMVRTTHSVVVCAVNISGHAKVSYLDQQVLPDQAVPGCQVSVDKVLGGQVDHASSNLLGNVQHLGLGELHQDTVLTVCHEHCIRTVGPAREKKKILISHSIIVPLDSL